MTVSEIRKLRELEITSKLAEMGVATASQLRRLKVGGLERGGDRNALRVLGQMEKDGFLESRRYGVKVFGVRGGGFGFWEHHLWRNEFLIWKGWGLKGQEIRFEVPIKVRGVEVLRADVGRLEDGLWTFLEVDRTQKPGGIREKVARYKELGLKLVVFCPKIRGKYWDCEQYYFEDTPGC